MVVLALLLVGCSPGTENTAPAGDSAACSGEAALLLTGEPLPGEVLTLQIEGASEVLWTVSAGTLSSDTDLQTVWSLPEDLALHTPEVLSVEASVDCEPDPLTAAVVVDWPESHRVLVIYNPQVGSSEEVARYYAGFREVPEANICGISTAADTTLAGEDLEAWIADLSACIETAGRQVMYLVPVYGTPYRVSGRIALASNYSTTTVSLDALAVLWEQAADAKYAIYSPFYIDGDSPSGVYTDYTPFPQQRLAFDAEYDTHALLVSRIDGDSASAAMDLVDRTAAAESLAAAGALSGTVYVDGRYGDHPPTDDTWGSYESGEWNMWGTRRVFEALDWYPVVWDGNSAEFGTEPAPVWCEDALYYAGWYSYYNYNDAFQWAPGAIGGHLDSCSACDIRSGETWAGGALQQGITATFGAVAEPYVAGMPEYDQLFHTLTQGASFAEAGYSSTILGFWMMTWIGDPLYRPYPQ